MKLYFPANSTLIIQVVCFVFLNVVLLLRLTSSRLAEQPRAGHEGLAHQHQRVLRNGSDP